MEKARSLLEAEANLDDMEEEPREPSGLHQPGLYQSAVHQSGAHQPGVEHGVPSGFVPATASQSGFSPAGSTLGDATARAARTPTESGVFAGVGGATGDRLVDSLQTALGAASRNEAGLGSLQRAIRDASRAFTATRQAQEALTEELRVMHRGLNELMSEKAAVERYAALLTQERDAALDAAEEARREAKREREFLLREQDRFIQLLLEEHEAELQQLRRSLSQQRAAGQGAEATRGELSPHTIPGILPTAVDEAVLDGRRSISPDEGGERHSAPPGEVGERRSSPPGEIVERRSAPPGELTGAALARYALGTASPAEPVRTVPLPVDHAAGEAGAEVDERSPTYPPAPAVLDLDSLASEVDGNSERPPPIRRLGVADPVLHLKPARVPTQLYDTSISSHGEPDPDRKG